MRAVYYDGKGRFSLGECEPVPPGKNEVRLRVAYCGICGTDLHIAQGHMDTRIARHSVIGHEMSGWIEELGPGVTDLSVGDPVVVRPLDTRDVAEEFNSYSHVAPGLRFMGIDSPGALQASWTVPAFTVHRLPQNVDLALAALVEPLAVACHDVRRGNLTPGERCVVIGGGPIGILISMVARELGATVLLSEPNPYRKELASKLGFETIDPTTDSVVDYVRRSSGGVGCDVVFEVSGSSDGAAVMTQLARVHGRIVVVAIFSATVPVNLFDFFWKELQVYGARVYEPCDFDQAIALLAAESVQLDQLLTAVEPLDRAPRVIASLSSNPSAMKLVIDCQS